MFSLESVMCAPLQEYSIEEQVYTFIYYLKELFALFYEMFDFLTNCECRSFLCSLKLDLPVWLIQAFYV